MAAAPASTTHPPPGVMSAGEHLPASPSRHAPAHAIVDAAAGTVISLDGLIAPYLAPSSGVASLQLFSLLRDSLHRPVREALLHAVASRHAASRHVSMQEDDQLGAELTILVEPLYPPPCSDRGDDDADTDADPGAGPGDATEASHFVVAFYPQPAGTVSASHPETMPRSGDRPISTPAAPDRRPDAWHPSGRDPDGSRQDLHAQVEELRYLNAELTARNDRLVRSNENFCNLLDSTLIATMFLDRELRICSFTHNMSELFALRELDIGRSITDLSSHLDYAQLEPDVAQVLGSLELVEREVLGREPDPRVFLMRMRPHRRPDDELDGVVLTFVDITARKRAENRAWFLAHHDQLTGLPNRAMFHTILEQGLRSADRTGGRVALLYLDLDRFKTVNDTFGHRVGDRLLQLVAKRLRACVPGGAVVCRQGGDEFAVVQIGDATTDELVALASVMLAAVTPPYEIDRHVVQIGISIGVASLSGAALDADGLTRAADLALYDAKAKGRGQYSVFRPKMEVEWQRRRGLELDLREAIARGQLALVYQPIVRLSDRRIIGAEALLRWHHPRHGTLPPATFIPIAEETGLIAAIGVWVLQTACADAARWAEPLCLSVNLSSVQFASLDLVDTVREVLAGTGLAPGRLALEVTETVLLHDNVRTQSVLAALRQAGVSIAMDDFGTGYSSLSYIRDFAIQKIKIDQAFIRTIDSQRASSVIVKAILTIGEGLGIGVCAEGVETEQQLAALQGWGVEEAQGFLLHRPMSSSRLTDLLADRLARQLLERC